jgi:Arm DNA-binding domain
LGATFDGHCARRPLRILPAVDALKPGDILADTEVKGFVARRLPSGVVTYGLRYRVAGNKQRWLALGLHGRQTPDGARKAAKKRVGKVADDRDPAGEREAEEARAKAASASTVNVLLDAFLDRHVRKNLRSAGEVERVFNKYVRPRIGDKSIYQLRRGDIVEMLDAIEDENGPVMADRTLAHVRKAFNWQAASRTPRVMEQKFRIADWRWALDGGGKKRSPGAPVAR